MFCKEDVLEQFAEFTENHLCWSLFLKKLKAWGMQLYLKETPAQVLFCEFYEIFKSTYFVEISRFCQ